MTKYLLRLARGLAVAAVVAMAAFAWASVAYAQGTWTPLAPVPAATEGMSVGGVGQVIIAAYGFSLGDTDLTRRYNITTNSWSLGATAPGGVSSEQAYGETPMPTARAGAASAVVDDAIFVIGGRTATGGPCSGGELSVVERYDIVTDTWSTVAPLPGLRSDLAAVSHGGKIFVFGGCDTSGVTGEVDKYDPETDTWTTGLAAMPTPRASLVAGKVGDTVFAIGGSTNGLGSGQVSTNESYKIASNSWSATPAAMTTARSEAGVHSHGGRVFVVGGGNRGASTDANEVYKPKP